MLWIEITATIFGVLCVWWTIRQNILCWPAGLIQVCLFIIIFYKVKLYSDLLLHIIYVFMSVYGWYHWLHGGQEHKKLQITKLHNLGRGIWILVAILGTYLWGHFMDNHTDASVPYADAFTTVVSLVAQWLLAKKKLESWYFWISVDIVAIGIYFYKKLYFTTGLYAIFLVLAAMGLRVWKKSYQEVFNNEAVSSV